MLQYEVEKYIPFKSNEVILDFEILKENIPQEGDSKTLELLLVAVKDSEVRELLGLFQRAEIEIEVIDIAALAFANLIEFVLPASREACVGFVDMGEESSTFGIALRGKPIFIRNISFGGGDVLKLLKRKLGLEAEAVLEIQRDAERQTEEYKLVVEQAFSGLLRELKLSVGYYLDHISGAEPIQTLLIAGGGFRFFSETEYLARELKVRVERLGILSRVSVGSGIDAAVFKKSEDLLPSALGLCLR